MKVNKIVALLCVAFATSAYSQDCRDGMCFVQQKGAPIVSEAPSYKWQKQGADQYILLRNGVVIGQYYAPDGHYYPWDGKKNLAPTKPPIDTPLSGHAVTDDVKAWCTNGVSSRRLSNEARLTHSGKAVHADQLHAAFAGALDDDSAKGSFVIIAKDDKDRARVFADWQKLPTEFTSRYNVWMAPPDHFSMQDRFNGKPRFYTEGDPTVILQDPTGVVLFRRPQAEQKYRSSDMQDLLKSDPSYDPKLDPGAPPPPPVVLPFKLTTAEYVSAGCGALALLLVGFNLFKRKK